LSRSETGAKKLSKIPSWGRKSFFRKRQQIDMVDEDLREQDLFILDILVNLGPIYRSQLSSFRWNEKTYSDRRIGEILERLVSKELVRIQQEEYAEVVLVPPSREEQARRLLAPFVKEKGVEKQLLTREAEKDLPGVQRLLGQRAEYEGKSRVIFSDYGDTGSLGLCKKLAKGGFLFYSAWSSRKHHYQAFYFRRTPLDVQKVLSDLLLQKLNLEDLDLSTDWPILIVLCHAEREVTIDDLQASFPGLTSDEIKEALRRLELRGAVTWERSTISIPEGLKDLVWEHFVASGYENFKNNLIANLRKRVARNISNLYLLGLAKRILTSAGAIDPKRHFVAIKRTLVDGIEENELWQLTKLGIAYLTTSELIIAQDVLLDLEDLFKSAIKEHTIERIPPNEQYTAIQVWRRLFASCTDYIKIQDEYVNEETLMIIDSYAPPNLEIILLSSTEGARDADNDEMQQILRHMRSKRNVDFRLIGYEHTRRAPFHERYIISKDVCYLLSQSIKDIGKSKSASILEIRRETKNSLIEPAFNHWAYTPNNKLKEQGIIRMTFEEWLENRPNRAHNF